MIRRSSNNFDHTPTLIIGKELTHGQFSVVVALYDVEQYVESFLGSLRDQKYPFQDLDIIIVNDGSTDDSMTIVDAWVRKFPNVIRSVSKSNGGPGSARNIGLALAKNKWVTFPDPDDMLDPEYFFEVDRFLAKDTSDRSELLTTRLVQHVDGSFRTNHGHPLDWKFKSGNRLINLDTNPDFVHLSGGTVFVRLATIAVAELRFDEDIRPKFEDANYIGRYLALVETPIVGLVSTARYYYRKRTDGTSLVQSSWSNPGVYTDVPKLGYLGMLESVRQTKGYVPRWAQSMVIYELVWAYAEQKNMHSVTGAASEEQKAAFLAHFDSIIAYIDRATIMGFGTIGQGWIFHNILLLAKDNPENETPLIVRWAVESSREFSKYSYLFAGNMPLERIEINGSEVVPLSTKTIGHDFFGRNQIFERVFVVPYGEISVYLNGRQAVISSTAPVPRRGQVMPLGKPRTKGEVKAVAAGPMAEPLEQACATGAGPLSFSRPSSGRALLRRNSFYRKIENKLIVQAMLQEESVPRAARGAAVRVSRRLVKNGGVAISKVSKFRNLIGVKSDATARKYKDAWILIDRKERADDNAEHLYRYLVSNRRDINAWFVIAKDSADWDRLSAEGFRLLPYGSLEAAAALFYASYNISSHADRDIQYPPHHRRYGTSKAKIVFLQHGVTKDDLSRWLNTKKIALMLVATRDEHASIVGDGTNYRLTSSEVVCAGFPRHDELRRLTLASEGAVRTNILLAPTWRQYLTRVLDSGLDADEVVSGFEASDFGRNWLGLLRDPSLGEIALEFGLRIRFLAHPNLASIVPLLKLPSYIDILDYRDLSVQQELVDAAVLVSDFSSLAFEGAFAGSNIIHFQFDGDEIYGGGHVYRKGYFDYQTMGFGPLLSLPSSVVSEIGRLATSNFTRPELYETRIRGTFVYWDQHNCERAVLAIENLNRPWWQEEKLSSSEY